MRQVKGFTLLELMIVVAIIAVIAIIALPSFTEQLRKTRRADALRGLSDLQLKQERYRANHPTYGTGAQLGLPTSQYYTFAVASASTVAYSMTAAPTAGGPQANDRCGTYTYSMSSGTVTKDASGGATNCGL